MSVLKRCPHNDCNELIPLDAMDCGGHAEEHPHLCLNCDTVIYGPRLLRCPVHRKEARLGSNRASRLYLKEATKPHRPEKVEPKVKPILLTDAEQEAINEEAIRREAARVDRIHRGMGLVACAGRPLASDLIPVPPEEIKRLERQYLPPARKEGSHLAPWALHGGGM